jgi:hypothetical protein
MGPEIVISALSGATTALGVVHSINNTAKSSTLRRFEKIEEDIEKLRTTVLLDYVLKEDFLREMQAVHNKLDRILDYLIHTANPKL